MEHQEDRFDAYYFVEDSSKDILSDFVELTGNPMFMPKYAFYQGNADCYVYQSCFQFLQMLDEPHLTQKSNLHQPRQHQF